MKLLVANKTHGSVLSAIMDMVERMLTLRETTPEENIADNEEDIPTPPLPQLPLNNILSLTIETMTKFKGNSF